MSLVAAVAALIVRRIQTARCWLGGMLPSATAAPSVAAAKKVTPAGAVFSLATVCSVPFTALVPTPMSMVVSALGVLAEIQATAFSSVSVACALWM